MKHRIGFMLWSTLTVPRSGCAIFLRKCVVTAIKIKKNVWLDPFWTVWIYTRFSLVLSWKLTGTCELLLWKANGINMVLGQRTSTSYQLSLSHHHQTCFVGKRTVEIEKWTENTWITHCYVLNIVWTWTCSLQILSFRTLQATCKCECSIFNAWYRKDGQCTTLMVTDYFQQCVISSPQGRVLFSKIGLFGVFETT